MLCRNILLLRKSVELLMPGLHFMTNFPAGVRDWAPFFISVPQRKFEMKTFVAACIAIGILWAVDVEFNDGRYSTVVQRALKGILAPRS